MIRFALANLLSRPGRTALSVFGLTIAIAGMVGLFSIAGGIDSLIDSSFGGIEGVVVLQNGAPLPLFSTLPAAWGEEMSRISGVSVVNPELWARANLIDGEPIFSPPRLLFGTDLPTRVHRRDLTISKDIQEGRFLDISDVGTNHAVISRQIAEQFNKTVGDPLEVNGTPLKIVGIYRTGSIIIDVTIVVDINLLRSMTRAAPDAVSAFYVEPDAGISNDIIIERITSQFRDRKLPAWRGGTIPLDTPPGAPRSIGEWVDSVARVFLQQAATSESSRSDAEESVDPEADREDGSQADSAGPIEVQSVADYGDQFQEMSADLNIILALLTGLGVSIAITSILNTMLMSVTERIVEFGILRANGWSQRNVVQLIVSEAALVGTAGGLLGVLAGWSATHLINAIWPDRIHLHAGGLLLTFSLMFAVVVGILGGFYPALRAARLSPMDAIRRS